MKLGRHTREALAWAADQPCRRRNCGTVCLCGPCHARRALAEAEEQERAHRTRWPLEYDGFPARAVGRHRGCRLGQRKSVVLAVAAPGRPFYVCGCDLRLLDDEIIFAKGPARVPGARKA